MSIPVKISLIFFFIVLLLAGGFGLYQVLSATIDTTDYSAKGDEFFQKKQYSSALSSYQKAINKKSEPNLYSKIAKIYELKSRFKDATDILQKGLESNPNYVDLEFQLAEDASELAVQDPASLELAIKSYTNAAKDDKYKNIATYKMARLTVYKADAESLAKAKIMFASLDYLPAKYELLLYSIDEPDKIISELDILSKLTAMKEENALIPEFGTWAEFGKNLKEQTDLLKADLSANKSKATIANSKGYIAYKTNRCEYGLDYMKTAIDESEKEVFYPQARLVYGECLKRLGKYDLAKTFVLPVYEKQKDSLDARLILRNVYKGLGDSANMKKMYDELITLDGQNLQTRLDYARDSEFVSDWISAATQYEWLALNLNTQSQIGDAKNADNSLNQSYLQRAYDLYVYKLKDYAYAETLITNGQKANPKFVEEKTADELVVWTKYMRNPNDANLQNQVLDKSSQLNNPNALYHSAVILKLKKQNSQAKEKALLAYDTDENGFLSVNAADIVNELEN